MDSKSLLEILEKHSQDINEGRICNISEWAAKITPLLKYFESGIKTNFEHSIHMYLRTDLGTNTEFQKQYLENMKYLLRQAIEELRHQLSEQSPYKTQLLLPSNSEQDFQKLYSNILSIAEHTIWIQDTYMSHMLIEEFTDIKVNEVHLLTSTKNTLTSKFLNRLEAAKKQLHGINIEARVSNEFHDRFVILDIMKVWHIGPSYDKSPGKNPSTFVEITDSEGKQKAIHNFKKT